MRLAREGCSSATEAEQVFTEQGCRDIGSAEVRVT